MAAQEVSYGFSDSHWLRQGWHMSGPFKNHEFRVRQGSGEGLTLLEWHDSVNTSMQDQAGLPDGFDVFADIGRRAHNPQCDGRFWGGAGQDLPSPGFDVLTVHFGNAKLDKVLKRGGVIVSQTLKKGVALGWTFKGDTWVVHAIHDHQVRYPVW